MAKNKETQDKEAAAKAASDKTAQENTTATDSADKTGEVTKVVEQTLEDFEKGIAEVDSSEELDAIEASEKEGKDRSGALEIIEKRRSELQEDTPQKKEEKDIKEQTLEDLKKSISGVNNMNGLKAAENAEKEGQNRSGAFEIIENRRSEILKERSERKNKSSSDKKKVKILVDNMAGKYLIAANKGQVIELEGKQADEVIKAKDGEEVK